MSDLFNSIEVFGTTVCPYKDQETGRKCSIHLECCTCKFHLPMYCGSKEVCSLLQHGTPPYEAMEKGSNQPHIILFSNQDDECLMKQYFICVEQELMLESSSITAAIFFGVAAHYVYNLSYHPKTGIIKLCDISPIIVHFL